MFLKLEYVDIEQVDSAANVQPEKVETIWNLRGVLNNSWHVIHVNSSAKAIRASL